MARLCAARIHDRIVGVSTIRTGLLPSIEPDASVSTVPPDLACLRHSRHARPGAHHRPAMYPARCTLGRRYREVSGLEDGFYIHSCDDDHLRLAYPATAGQDCAFDQGECDAQGCVECGVVFWCFVRSHPLFTFLGGYLLTLELSIQCRDVSATVPDTTDNPQLTDSGPPSPASSP